MFGSSAAKVAHVRPPSSKPMRNYMLAAIDPVQGLGLILSIALAAYLLYALLRPDRF